MAAAPTSVGARIRARRIQADLTQVELAQAVQVGQTAVSQWERGLTVPTLRNLATIAKVLGCTQSDLLADIAA